MKEEFKVGGDNAVDFGDTGDTFFLIGLLNEFINRFQTVGDSFFKEISWKQCFVLICIRLFEQPPTLGELSDMMGSSHQNIKQMLNKLEKTGFVQLVPDEKDRRKQRILLTEKTRIFNEENDKPSADFMGQLFQDIDREQLEITTRTIMRLDDQLKKMKV